MRHDHGGQIADILVQLAGVLDGLQPDEWAAQSLCERWSVRDVAGHLVWRVGGSYGDMLRSALPMLTLTHFGLDPVIEAVARQEAEASGPDELVRRLRRIAALRGAGIGRTGTNDLVETLVHAYDIVQPLGVPIEVDPDASRRVALRGLMLASPDRRTVVARNTLYAADAGWAIGPAKAGTGSIIEGSAQGIVLYLYGRRPIAKSG
jgi:uncharacterized protein (TIGR03083 family)